MNDDQVVAILRELGWRVGKDEVGDKFCALVLNGRQLQVIPTIRKVSDHFRVTLMPSVSTKEFSSAVSFICGRDDKYTPIIVSNDIPLKLHDLSRDDVVSLSEAAISWALAQDIGCGLEAYRNLPTDSKGAGPLRHLAALVIVKDLPRLAHYQKAFEEGDRLGFVPYITKAMIDRAVELVSKSRNGESST